MKVLQISLTALIAGSSAAATLRGDSKRDLQVLYYPRYTDDYDTAWCTSNNNFARGSGGYATELACCNAVFPNQPSGKCYSMLPAPPTVSPTATGGPDAWYADFDIDFKDGVCINKMPAPNGRTIYTSQLDCCKGEYGTQTSGACLADLPNPPTVSPTATGGVDIYYKAPNVDYALGYCQNTLPTPNGVVTYETMLDCCKGEYASQTSGACLSYLPAPPTVSPTGVDGPDAWYSDHGSWEVGKCINTAPVPVGREVYESQLECCKAFYGTQTSGACLADLPNPPTVSPTATGGVDIWYKAPDVDYALGECINTLPTPNGAVTYSTQLDCCKGEYASQTSGACLAALPNPPTVSPTATGGPDAWYADFDLGWTNGKCINTMPAPQGRTIYESQLECCLGAYPAQESGTCIADLPNPPTVSPTATGGVDIYYKAPNVDYAAGYCTNELPTPNGVVTYETMLDCCKGEYASQTSGACLAALPNPPTVSPTGADGPDAWYSDHGSWEVGKCINTAPVPVGREVYESQLECCKAFYGTQESGACLADLPNPPTVSPTGVAGPDAWYKAPDMDWSVGVCINTLPTPNGATIYASQLECCQGAYAGQSSGACLAGLPNPPTVSPTGVAGPDAWYSDHGSWEVGKCINTAPVPVGREVYESQLECCKGYYGSQTSGACLAGLPNPPTSSPIGASTAKFFPIWDGWQNGHCDNDPTKATSGNNYQYDTQEECCEAWFKDQESNACLTFDPTYGSRSPTQAPVL